MQISNISKGFLNAHNLMGFFPSRKIEIKIKNNLIT